MNIEIVKKIKKQVGIITFYRDGKFIASSAIEDCVISPFEDHFRFDSLFIFDSAKSYYGSTILLYFDNHNYDGNNIIIYSTYENLIKSLDTNEINIYGFSNLHSKQKNKCIIL
jgi:hypothetical protein